MAGEFTQQQVDALRAAIASGVKTVAFGNRSITYNDLDEMRTLLGLMEGSLAAAGGTGPLTHRVSAHSKAV